MVRADRSAGDDEALLIAVANTGHGEPDEFADPRMAVVWWQSLGAARAGAAALTVAPEDLEMLRTLRAVIRRAALRNNGIAVEVDTAALDGFTLRPDLTSEPSLRAGRAGHPAADLCAAVIAALLRASARPSWPRFKACRGADCHWVFVDGSRNTSRRWCDMAACGNRAKGESFRARQRAVPSGRAR